jgi:hypothetical protein
MGLGAGLGLHQPEERIAATVAPTFDEVVSRVSKIAPEIAIENRLASPGEETELPVIAARVAVCRKSRSVT